MPLSSSNSLSQIAFSKFLPVLDSFAGLFLKPLWIQAVRLVIVKVTVPNRKVGVLPTIANRALTVLFYTFRETIDITYIGHFSDHNKFIIIPIKFK